MQKLNSLKLDVRTTGWTRTTKTAKITKTKGRSLCISLFI